MKHTSGRSKDFAEHFLGLLKNSGNTGNIGNSPINVLNQKNKTVSSDPAQMFPVSEKWKHPGEAIGNNKVVYNQSLAEHVSTVSTVSTVSEQGQHGPDEPESGGSPAKWHAILAELEARNCPERLSLDRWQEVIADAEIFLSRWGSAAHSLGWTALDLFGVHPSAPAARFDVMGLLLLVQGGAVVALTADAATIRRKTGALLSCRRPVAPGAILISAVQP
jgi:hypothetical protein